MFVEDYVGGAELTTEAIIKDSLLPVIKVHSRNVNERVMKKHHDKFWVFGNFSSLSESSIMFACKNLCYSILEYDYKYCIYRSPEKHASIVGKCNCHKERRGKLVSIFYKKAKTAWFMSHSQMNQYVDKFPFLNNTKVLSSAFSKET